ncbi:hypothetical protein KI688_007869 [Linnemannia hyalina]|uniref:Uncharacterized protein n=1 Tax=Linnemannia hyalina TaxID=64524 RepID=A0A9P8BPI0_9FUNG|nr:hypothetical protein KI688_007869 [Linnemannia hyalina]
MDNPLLLPKMLLLPKILLYITPYLAHRDVVVCLKCTCLKTLVVHGDIFSKQQDTIWDRAHQPSKNTQINCSHLPVMVPFPGKANAMIQLQQRRDRRHIFYRLLKYYQRKGKVPQDDSDYHECGLRAAWKGIQDLG